MSTIFEFKRSVIRKSKSAKQIEIYEKLCQHEERVANAIEEGKVFKFIAAWDVPRIKFELYKRGFIETVPNPFYNLRSALPLYNLIDAAESYNDYEQALLCKILGDHPPDFVWTEQPYYYSYYNEAAIINKINFGNVNFWLKDGSCHYIRSINYKIKKYKNRIKYPRSYDLIGHKETIDFMKDYRFTTAVSLIMFLNDQQDIAECFSKNDGNVHYNSLDFALNVIDSRLRRIRYPKDKTNPNFHDKKYHNQWRKLFKAHHKLIIENQKILCNVEKACELVERIALITERLLLYFPSRKYDGYHNWWLLKPTYSGEGRGIIITQSEKEILHHVNSDNQYYIVQKYIEKPFLCYNTKFDIRQYFLITVDRKCLRCWWHSTMSVKFASDEFRLDVFNETIHLTNAAIQIKYKRKSDPNLPMDHLWSVGPLTTYMERFYKMGYMWNDHIVPEMKKAISHIFHACMHSIELRPGRYELFGNDWIITEDFEPVLLEINRPPSLVPVADSPVSEVVCNAISEDIIRVAVDFYNDDRASTGGFEVMHEYTFEELKNLNKSDYFKAVNEL